MKILVIAEHDNKILKPYNEHVLTAAKELNGEIDILIIGYECDTVVSLAEKLPVRHIIVANNKEFEHQLPENVAEVVAKVGAQYQYIISTATTFGKNLLPRVAALLDVGMIADVVEIMSTDTFIRPIYAGNALATVKSQDPIKVLSIRTTAFPIKKWEKTHTAEIIPFTQVIPNNLSTFVNQELTVSARPDLTSARIIISGGRGLKSAENFKLLEKLADQLGAAIGASRAAVDAGFAPNDYQVGQTGKVVAPELYIAVGISGAIQHLAGMKDSKVIVAINNDPDAPIFQIADYGLVADLFSALAELQKEFE